jgi:hypothetical protein
MSSSSLVGVEGRRQAAAALALALALAVAAVVAFGYRYSSVFGIPSFRVASNTEGRVLVGQTDFGHM